MKLMKMIIVILASFLLLSCSTILDYDSPIETGMILGTWHSNVSELEVEVIAEDAGEIKLYVYDGNFYEYRLDYIGPNVTDGILFHRSELETIFSNKEDTSAIISWTYIDDQNHILVGLIFFDTYGNPISTSVLELYRDGHVPIPITGDIT